MGSTSAPSSCTGSTVQDLIALPFTWTTQAPHCEVSQPTCVPVSRRFSRSNWTRSVRGSTSAVTDLPFTVRETAAICASSDSPKTLLLRTARGRLSPPKVENPTISASFRPWNQNYSELRLPPGQGICKPPHRDRASRRCAPRHFFVVFSDGRGAHRGSKFLKKIVGKLLGGTVDQALAKLRELAADLRLD